MLCEGNLHRTYHLHKMLFLCYCKRVFLPESSWWRRLAAVEGLLCADFPCARNGARLWKTSHRYYIRIPAEPLGVHELVSHVVLRHLFDWTFAHRGNIRVAFQALHRRSQYEAKRGTRLGKILPNTVDFYFFYQTDNIRRFHTADFVQRTVCSPRL